MNYEENSNIQGAYGISGQPLHTVTQKVIAKKLLFFLIIFKKNVDGLEKKQKKLHFLAKNNIFYKKFLLTNLEVRRTNEILVKTSVLENELQQDTAGQAWF